MLVFFFQRLINANSVDQPLPNIFGTHAYQEVNVVPNYFY